ncbi:hypothetical protein LCGC14_1666890, partial [marine sediment metagenome]
EGPVSIGICSLCGEEREFTNYILPGSYDATLPGRPLTYWSHRITKKEEEDEE